MHGIFFDEVVGTYTAHAAEYMQAINEAVKATSGLLGDKTVSKILSLPFDYSMKFRCGDA
jgi:hypothetical protein